MANKDNIQSIDLNGTLNLNRYRCDIKQFEGFNEKNASIFGNVLTPFFHTSYDTDYFGINNKVYHVDENYNDNYIALYKDNTLISTLPKYSISKSTIKLEKNIRAFEFDSEDENVIHLFVEGEEYYQFIDYDVENDEIISTTNTSISIGNLSSCDMIDGNVVFYNSIGSRLYICNKNDSTYISFSNSGSPICTVNKLDSTFDATVGGVSRTRYLISYCGRSGNINVNAENVHNVLFYTNASGNISYNEVTLISSTLNTNQIPKFAPKVYGTDVVFYYVTDIETINASTSSTPTTVYMTATPTSFNSGTNELTVTCDNSLIVKNSSANTSNKCSVEITPFFCSILIGCQQNNTNTYFDSVNKYFIGNTGYITSNDSTRYIPFGHKIDYSNNLLSYKFSILMNYNNISNISVTYKGRTSNIGTIITEWNSISEQANICVSDYKCMFKNTDNTLSLIKIENKAPQYRGILDRYIVFDTPYYTNIFDTQRETFYHAFTDYNNRMIMCEKKGDTSISDFPSGYGLSTPYNYIYSSAINANMEVNNIYISSIEYNPNIIENGRHDKYYGEFVECGEYGFNEVVDVYWDNDNTATTSIYRRSFATHTSYFDNSLRNIPYPITSNGNILYSSNIFSEFINSYSNKDFIINDNVGYPLTYINNQPTLNFYFLSGIEYINSAFILQGMNYVNTNNMIFSVMYNGDVISYTEPLVAIQGFKFLGNTTKCAFYYSNFTKSVYGFFGDRTLNKLIDCSSIADIKNVYFNPKEYKIYVVTAKNIVVIDDETMYTINVPNVINISFTNDFIILNIDANDIKSELLTYHSATNKERFPIKLTTQYYGLGNNIKSVVDCIYLRLFYDYDSSFDVKGDVKLNIVTLTDCGKKSEEKIFSILPSDWDSETKTVYLRYQPKYQECVGMEISIESPFAIATLDVGYSTDGTIQNSKFNS